MGVFILKEMGLSKSRIDEIIIKDDLKHKDKKRDIRLNYDKISSCGIHIKTSEDSIINALREFNLY